MGVGDLSSVEFNDFRGGLNTDAAPHALAPDEVLSLHDALIDGPGQLRRRGNYEDVPNADRNGAAMVYGEQVICAGPHLYHTDSHGIFVLTSTDTQSHVKWWVPGYNSVEVFDYGYPATDGRVRAGFTPPPRSSSDDGVSGRNAKFNATVISCDAFTVAIKVSRSEFADDPGEHQFRTHKTVMVNGTEHDYYFETTVILAAADTGLGNDVDSRVPALMDHNVCPYVETVSRFSFLAGDTGLPQHYRWSRAENCHSWSEDDIEHAPTESNDHINALTVVGGMLGIVKERSIFLLRVLDKPPSATNGQGNWEMTQACAVGALDGRSVQRYQDGIVFASQSGVYYYDGVSAPRNLCDGKIQTAYRSRVAGWTRSRQAVGVMVDDYYVLSLRNADGTLNASYACHLTTQTWTRISNLNLVASSPSIGGRGVYGFLASGRAVNLTRMFSDPDGTFEASPMDPEGDGPHLYVELPVVTTEQTDRIKAFREVHVDFFGTAHVGDPRLKVRIVGGLTRELPAAKTLTVASLPAESPTGHPWRCHINGALHDRAARIVLSEDTANGQFSQLTLYGAQLAFRAPSPRVDA